MATSFISERSAELSIVPHLKIELEKHFNYVAPLFPWINREASKISRIIHQNDKFKILVLFPRRPKLRINDNETIFVTINDELKIFKEFASDLKVPVIAGCPISTNFWELSRCKNHFLIKIDEEIEYSYLNSLNTGRTNKDIQHLSVQEIVEMIHNSTTFNIEMFAEFLSESKTVLPRSFIFGARYKPVYFFIRF